VLDTSNFLRIVNICGQTVDCYTSVVLCPAQTVVCLCIRPCVCVCVCCLPVYLVFAFTERHSETVLALSISTRLAPNLEFSSRVNSEGQGSVCLTVTEAMLLRMRAD